MLDRASHLSLSLNSFNKLSIARKLISCKMCKILYVIINFFGANYFLAGLCSCGGWFESRYVQSPDDRFCRDEAHLLSCKPRVKVT